MNISHKAIGNFPVLDDFSHYPQYVEIMDKYYKYTVTTNESGDYMIFGYLLDNILLLWILIYSTLIHLK